MWSTVGVVFLGLAIFYASAEGDREQFMKMLMTYKEDCSKNKEADDKTFENAWNLQSAPDNEEGNCFLLCMMKHLGGVENGRFKEDVFRQMAAHRWDDPESVEKSNSVNKECIQEVGDLKEGCSSIGELINCIMERNEKAGLK